MAAQKKPVDKVTVSAERSTKKANTCADTRATRRVLSEAEGEALSRRLAEPGRKPTQSMVAAVRTHKRLMSERSAR